ncbi:AEC family transporter [Bacillus spizizenii]|uniref:AEC family transporter n=1 Tax=Bacillus spizizenii TaxID=96241 RepID=UPI00227F5A27|nr:AEC family transporter [Bacillus spizizenii]MCY7796264.1 AEC family transporter [Bacillus spizizenii]MCY7802375.1 AEC family transporter [Bacillus spizizenii]MCY7878234.1 AEC family transporter [Bacillus spizizenii]MCY7896049.1 AEC family transporter [Bacillus spizizenii]MCY8212141.1 AEC family transporter [Bacillus spizizenii]
MEFLFVLVPVFGIFAIGYIGQKTLGFDIQTLSKMSLYLMSPFLAFDTFYTNKLTMDYVYLSIFVLGLCLILVLFVYFLSFYHKYPNQDRCAMILSSAFMNNGNYGTPVVLLVFGTAGLDTAVVLMVLQQLIMSTIGMYYAAKGGSEVGGFKMVMARVIRMPVAYGALLGAILQLMRISIPKEVMTGVELVGNAAIPTIMIILGMQLALISFKHIEYRKISYSLLLKLMVSPVIALGFTFILPVDDMTKQIMILVAAMPTAANTTLMAVQFNTRPEIVSSATFISTMLSIVTLPVLLWMLHPLSS